MLQCDYRTKVNMSYNVLLQKSNDKRLLNNGIFNVNIDVNLSVFKKLKDFLALQGINLNTIDVISPQVANLIIYFDLPYPNNLKSWFNIIKYKKKSILFVYEPPMVNPFNYIKLFHKFFKRIFVWSDDSVDNKKYFKFHIQQSGVGLQREKRSFAQKKFLVMISGNLSLIHI